MTILIFVIGRESKNVPSVISTKMQIKCSIWQVEKFNLLNVLQYDKTVIKRVLSDILAYSAWFKASLNKMSRP